jgi:hypothetical protein
METLQVLKKNMNINLVNSQKNRIFVIKQLKTINYGKVF